VHAAGCRVRSSIAIEIAHGERQQVRGALARPRIVNCILPSFSSHNRLGACGCPVVVRSHEKHVESPSPSRSAARGSSRLKVGDAVELELQIARFSSHWTPATAGCWAARTRTRRHCVQHIRVAVAVQIDHADPAGTEIGVGRSQISWCEAARRSFTNARSLPFLTDERHDVGALSPLMSDGIALMGPDSSEGLLLKLPPALISSQPVSPSS